MSFDSRLQEKLTQLHERLAEQAWFQEIKAKWETLDPQVQSTLRFGTVGACVLVFLLVFGGIYSNVQSKKQTYEDRVTLLHSLRMAAEEIRTLESQGRSSGQGSQEVNWNQYVTRTSGRAGIEGDRARLLINRRLESTLAEERLLEIELSRVNVRQLTQFAHYLENGSEPIKLRNIRVETEGEDGYLNAKIYASAFALTEETD